MNESIAENARPVACQLSIGDWRVVMGTLREVPHRIHRRIADSLLDQLPHQSRETPQ